MVVSDVGELPLLYAVCEIAFVGGSLLEGQEGHNLAEAAVTGCAVLVGRHAGQFNRMAGRNQVFSSSVVPCLHL